MPVPATIDNLQGSLGYGKKLIFKWGINYIFGKTYTAGRKEFYIFNVSNLESSVSVLGNQETDNSIPQRFNRAPRQNYITTIGYHRWPVSDLE